MRASLLVSEVGALAQATKVARALSQPGLVTCDEYFHFLARAFTYPSPAFQGWRRDAQFRYPLLFALKYLLAKTAIEESPIASFDEIIGAYATSGFVGDEDEERFISVIGSASAYEQAGRRVRANRRRQARESLLVIAQISYLHVQGSNIVVSLERGDAHDLFNNLPTVLGPCARNRDAELRRLAGLFVEGSTELRFDYPRTIINDIVESGFREGSKVKRTHMVIERNARLRLDFFAAHPVVKCDICSLDTARTYPWTERVLDLHHLLPLCSGTRIEENGTSFGDLRPVCPTCHRAVHRFYDGWLEQNHRADFMNRTEAFKVYDEAKSVFPGPFHD